MEEFWKSISLVLVATILGLALGKTEKELSMLLTIAVFSITAVIALRYLKPVLDLLWQLNDLAQLNHDVLKILLKAVGVALVAELSALVCSDAGNHSMSKMIQLLGSTVISFLSIPIIQSLISLIQDLLFTL